MSWRRHQPAHCRLHSGAAEIRAHPHSVVAKCVLVALQRQSIARAVCVDLPTSDRSTSCTFLLCMCCEHTPDSSAAASFTVALSPG
jgi:hypothetical protein